MVQEAYQPINRTSSQVENTCIIPPYWVSEGIMLGHISTIGPAILIENQGRIESVSRIRQSVILEGTHLEPDTLIEHEVVSPRSS